jgi:hypothetical protein
MKRRLQPASYRARRSRNARRALLTSVGLTLAIVAVPASASAAVRTGSVQDAQGDASALSGPVLDIKSFDVRYDDIAGTVGFTWTYYNDVRIGSDPIRSPSGVFGIGAPLRPGADQGAYGGWSGHATPDGWSLTTNLQLSGTSGMLPGNVTMSDDGRVVTAEFTSPMLAGRDFQRSIRSPNIGGDTYDEFWFDGYSDPGPSIYQPGGTLPPGGGGGGGTNGNQGMTINDGAQYTNDPDVTLSVIAPSWANSLRVANDGGFRAAETFPPKKTIRWHLAESGPERLPKTVYLRFGNEAQNFTDDIILDQTKPTVSSAAVVDAGVAASSASVAQAADAKTETYRVRIRAKDATSGVAKVQFARNKKHPSSLRKFARTTRYKAARAPKYLRVQDRAGNFSRWRSVR